MQRLLGRHWVGLLTVAVAFLSLFVALDRPFGWTNALAGGAMAWLAGRLAQWLAHLSRQGRGRKLPARVARLRAHRATVRLLGSPPRAGLTSQSERFVLYLALLALLIGLVIYHTTDDFLVAFHRPGEPARGLATTITPVAAPVRRTATIAEAVRGWRQFASDAARAGNFVSPAAPLGVVHLALLADSLLIVPAYSTLLALLVLWARRALLLNRRALAAAYRTQRRSLSAALLRLGRAALLAAWIAALADWLENGLIWESVRRFWSAPPGATPAQSCAWGSVVCNWYIASLGLAVAIKWIAIALALAYILYVLVLLAWYRRRSGSLVLASRAGAQVLALGRALIALRLPIGAACFLALILYTDQAQEIVRRWADPARPWTGLPGAGAALALAGGALTASWAMLLAGETPPRLLVRPRSHQRYWFLGGITLLLALLALRYRNIFPLVPFFLITAGSWLLSLPVQATPADLRRHRLFGYRRLPGLVAGAFTLALTLTLTSGAVELGLYRTLRPVMDGSASPSIALGGYAFLFLACSIALFSIDTEPFFRCLFQDRLRFQQRRVPIALAGLALGGGSWLLLAWRLADRAWLERFGQMLGAAGVVCLALLLLIVTGTSLILLVDHLFTPVPPLFRLIRLQRLPLLSLLVVWAILAALLPKPYDLNTIRTVTLAEPPPGTLRSGVTLGAAFDEWRARRCLDPALWPVSAGPKPVAPLLLVTTSGGGIRAATWTTYVLDTILGYDPALAASPCSWPTASAARPAVPAGSYRSDWVFAASGISGGSVGLATYAARLTRPGDTPAARDPETDSARSGKHGWIREDLGQDLLSPSLAWMLLIELPWSFVRIGVTHDRAAILEESWERALGLSGAPPRLFNLYESSHPALAPPGTTPRAAGPDLPLLLFNSASVESGCRFESTVLTANDRQPGEPVARCLAPARPIAGITGVLGATNDLADFLCTNQDLPLSTAAFISARFPIISPSANLSGCITRAQPVPPRTYLVDGGYLDGSGTATIVALWDSLAPLVEQHNRDPRSPAYLVPMLVQIENGYGEPAAPSEYTPPPQFVAPLFAYGASHSGFEAMARQNAQILFTRPFILPGPGNCAVTTPRYAYFALRAHPGPSAKLGWTLSPVAFDDLTEQLRTIDEFDRQQQPRATVERWFAALQSTLLLPTCLP